MIWILAAFVLLSAATLFHVLTHRHPHHQPRCRQCGKIVSSSNPVGPHLHQHPENLGDESLKLMFFECWRNQPCGHVASYR